MTSGPFVEVKNLRRVFDVSKPWLNRVLEGGHLEFLKAVDDISFDIAKGETFALVGESGSGKTTVARMVVGLLPPTSGDVVIDGVSMTDPRQSQARRRIAPPHPDDFPGPLCEPQSAASGRCHRRRTDPSLRSAQKRARHSRPRRRIARSGRPACRRRLEISARVFRRPAPAHRDCARAGVRGRIHRLRRADLGARRFGSGADPQPDARPARQVRPHLSLHQPQPRRGPAYGERASA